MGSLEKASFYSDKALLGDCEGEDSIIKRVAVDMIDKHLRDKENLKHKSLKSQARMKKSNVDRMPSPSSFGGGKDLMKEKGIASQKLISNYDPKRGHYMEDPRANMTQEEYEKIKN